MKTIVFFVVTLLSAMLGAAGQAQTSAAGIQKFSLQLGKELNSLRFTTMTGLKQSFNVDLETVQKMIDHQARHYTAGASPPYQPTQDKQLWDAFNKANQVDILLGKYLNNDTSLAKIAEQLGVDEIQAAKLAYAYSTHRRFNEVTAEQMASDFNLTDAKHEYGLLLNDAISILDTQKLQELRDAWRQLPANTEATERVYKKLYDAVVNSKHSHPEALLVKNSTNDKLAIKALDTEVKNELAEGADLQAVVERFVRESDKYAEKATNDEDKATNYANKATKYADKAIKFLAHFHPHVVKETFDQMLQLSVLGDDEIDIHFLNNLGGWARADVVFARVAHFKDERAAQYMYEYVRGYMWMTEALKHAALTKDVDAIQFLIDKFDSNPSIDSIALAEIVMEGRSEQDIQFMRALGTKITRTNLDRVHNQITALKVGPAFYPDIARDFSRLEEFYYLDNNIDNPSPEESVASMLHSFIEAEEAKKDFPGRIPY